MDCTALASTGNALPWVAIAAAALVLVVLGFVILVRRTGVRAYPITLLVLIVGVTAAGLGAPSVGAKAACQTAPSVVGNSLTITQTSVNAGLSPAAASSLLAGTVTNNGSDEAYVTAIVASIVAVHRSVSAVPGRCEITDFDLTTPRMPVETVLNASGGAVAFSGARIGLVDKSTNQDACMGATIDLLYTAL